MNKTQYNSSFNKAELFNSNSSFKGFVKQHLLAVGSNAERQVRFAVEALLYFYCAGDRGIWIINAILEAAYVGGLKPKACLDWLREIIPHQTTSKAYEVIIQSGPNKGGSRKVSGIQFTSKKPGEDYPCLEDVQAYLDDKPNYMDVEREKKEKALTSVSDLLKKLRSDAERGDAECQKMAKVAISAILLAEEQAVAEAEQEKIDKAVAEAMKQAMKPRKPRKSRKAKAKAKAPVPTPEKTEEAATA